MTELITILLVRQMTAATTFKGLAMTMVRQVGQAISTGGDMFSNITNALNDLAGKIKGVAGPGIIVCFACAGVMFLFGSDMSRKAKGWIFSIIIAIGVIFGSSIIYESVKGIYAF